MMRFSNSLHRLLFTYCQLAELKTIFDRFAVEGAMTAPETCQALTEAGVIVPRRYWAISMCHVPFCSLL